MVANVALPDISRSLGTSQTGLTLVALGCTLGLAMSVLYLGAIGDRYGRRRMLLLGQNNEFDIIITEIGGTVGDIESLPFIEAVRQLQWELPDEDTVVVHLTLIPYLKAAKELKTKPTQHSVKMLSQEGVQPDVIVCRTEEALSPDIRRKIALFCNVKQEAVIEALDASTIYEVPLIMVKENYTG